MEPLRRLLVLIGFFRFGKLSLLNYGRSECLQHARAIKQPLGLNTENTANTANYLFSFKFNTEFHEATADVIFDGSCTTTKSN